jgi:hypothetical protein
MPTILRLKDSLRVVIYPNDHDPAHVHVIGAEKEARFILNCQGGDPELMGNYKFSSSEINKIKTELSKEIYFLCKKWREIHG